MSLTELLLNQKPILIGLGLTGGMLLLAISFALLSYLRQANAAHAARRSVYTQFENPLEQLAEEVEAVSLNPGAHSALAQSAVPQQQDAGQAETQQGETAEPEVSAALQDIISAVFMDEDRFAHYELLRSSTQPVDITELARLSKKVAQQLDDLSAPAQLHRNGAS